MFKTCWDYIVVVFFLSVYVTQKVRLNIPLLSSGMKRREPASPELKQLQLLCQSSRPLGFFLFRPVVVWPGPVWPS